MAKAKLAMHVPGPKQYMVPFAYGGCYVGTTWVVKNLAACLHEHINGQSAISYWHTKCGYTCTTWNKTNWPSFTCAMNEIPLAWQQWVLKFVSGHFSHGKNMQCWHFWTLLQCPWCHDPLEDKLHIIMCLDPLAVTLWQNLLSQLQQWLQEQMTCHMLADDLISGLQRWHDEAPNDAQQLNYLWQEEQQEIGWIYVLDGWLSAQWCNKQEQFWSHIHSRKSSKQWTLELIKTVEHCVGYVGTLE